MSEDPKDVMSLEEKYDKTSSLSREKKCIALSERISIILINVLQKELGLPFILSSLNVCTLKNFTKILDILLTFILTILLVIELPRHIAPASVILLFSRSNSLSV